MQKFRTLRPTQTDDGLPTVIVSSYVSVRPRLGFEFRSDRSFRLSGFNIFDTSRKAAQLTNIDSMEQSPSSEDNSFSANQEIPRILWNSELHPRVRNIPPLVPVPLQVSPRLSHPLSWKRHFPLIPCA